MDNDSVHVGLLTIKLYLPGCRSLKQKRSLLKPLIAGLHKAYNLSAAEVGAHDFHQSAVLACTVVSNNDRHIQRILEKIPLWIEKRRPDLQIVDSEYVILV